MQLGHGARGPHMTCLPQLHVITHGYEWHIVEPASHLTQHHTTLHFLSARYLAQLKLIILSWSSTSQ